MAANLGTVGEYVISFYSLWMTCANMLVMALLLCGVVVLSVLALLSQYSQLNCEENKVRLFDKQ